jgi:hypothetical protein
MLEHWAKTLIVKFTAVSSSVMVLELELELLFSQDWLG